MSFISNLIKKLGDWFAHIFDNSEKLYNTLTEQEKQAANYAYGIISLVDKYGESALPYIKIAYPDLSEDVLHGFIATLLTRVHAVDDNVPITLTDALKALAAYTNKYEGDTWAQIVQGAGNILAIIFSPTTPIQKFINVAEYVYQLFVKPHVESPALAAAVIANTNATGCDKGFHWDDVLLKCVKDSGGGLPPDPTHPIPAT